MSHFSCFWPSAEISSDRNVLPRKSQLSQIVFCGGFKSGHGAITGVSVIYPEVAFRMTVFGRFDHSACFSDFDRSLEKSSDATVLILKSGQVRAISNRWFNFLGDTFTQCFAIVPNVFRICELRGGPVCITVSLRTAHSQFIPLLISGVSRGWIKLEIVK